MTVPVSARCTPASTLTKVDLPAPLSPTIATTWPADTSRSTSVSAATAPKLLLIPRSDRTAVSVAASSLIPCSVHAAAYSPVHTSDGLIWSDFDSTSAMLSSVTTVGSNSCDGVSNSVVLPAGFSPFTNWYATSAAASATILIGLEIVLYWSPATIRCAAATSKSLPVTGGTGVAPAALNAAIAPPPVPSFAATTPTIWLPNRVICPDTQSCAFAGCQSGVSNSASSSNPLSSIAEWMPFLISPAAASVGEPLTSRIPPCAPVSFRCLTRDVADRLADLLVVEGDVVVGRGVWGSAGRRRSPARPATGRCSRCSRRPSSRPGRSRWP